MTAFETIKKIMAKLNNEIFAEMDAKVLEETKVWAAGRVAAIREFKNSGDPEIFNSFGRIINTHTYYKRLFLIAGGKTWYNVFNGRNEAMINEFVAKNCKATAEKRNAMIARKLEKAGVTEVTSTTFNRTKDGFNGEFVVMTDTGERYVTVETIYAGGYNVQCLHLRVLVKVR